MNEAHDAAYRAAVYRVDIVPPFDLRVGEPAVQLDELLHRHAVTSWAFLTACNPGSVRLSPEENAKRMKDLRGAVGGFVVYDGEGTDPAGAWPGEPSLLALGISRTEAVKVAERFGQNAILCGDRGGVAELVWVTAGVGVHTST